MPNLYPSLVWKAGKFYLAVPACGENQALVVVAINPSVRTSLPLSIQLIPVDLLVTATFRAFKKWHTLISRTSKAGKQKQKRRRLVGLRMRQAVQNLIDELHHKAALFLVKNVD
ncbi:MAG: hypothetical protein LUO95_01375 [Methylococcaceae bacterium]|nr:hypothetical protein [Methylococcaceae bacterium]MDD1609283.1 hypothetical protein [Methylococcaceae bacterium]MDD1615585.1 hypothetical protein [Methylococcaceae bacterium]OYV19938.1 MAG: Transposase, IS605 OrfB family, central region [Methylococcaceae bacterium NSP1-2]